MVNGLDIDLKDFGEVTDLLGSQTPLDPRVFMAAMVAPGAAASVLKFAFPGFVEHRHAVFLDFAFDQEVVDSWFDRLDDPVAVERVVNHVHLWDVLAPSANLEAEARSLLGPLARLWSVALRESFPARVFSVLPIPEGDYGPELSFHSRLESRAAPS